MKIRTPLFKFMYLFLKKKKKKSLEALGVSSPSKDQGKRAV